MSTDPALAALLAERDHRTVRRAELTARYAAALVQLTIVAPGPEKDGPLIADAARRGMALLEEALAERGLRPLYAETRNGGAGPWAIWVLDADAALVKSVAVGLENGSSLGRLWDFDVYDSGGCKLDREMAGWAPRTCFVCGNPAAVCAGRRLHEPAVVVQRFKELLKQGIEEMERKGAVT